MKVTYKHDEPNEVYFVDVRVGEVFLKHGEVWMKTPLFAQEADEDAYTFNCIRLEDAETDELSSSELVVLPKSAEMVVEW